MQTVILIAITKYLLGNKSPEELIEHAGRVCYRGKNKGTTDEKVEAIRARFIQKRVEEGHESIVEHASATFEIEGISRAASHQLVRHRVASYSQESQRYVDMSDPKYVMPDSVAVNLDAAETWFTATDQIERSYRRLRELGIKKQDARFLLPNAAVTRIVVTMNFRSLLHLFKVRISPHAQWEIRGICVKILQEILPHAPNVFGPIMNQLQSNYPTLFEVNKEKK